MVGLTLEEAVHACNGVASVAARLDVDERFERNLQLKDVPRGKAAQVDQQIAVAATHARVEGKHKPVLYEQHLEARVRAKHL